MIITQLLGGLGNQLFQYSVGRMLAEKSHTRLKLDTSAFREYRLRPYKLQHFHVEADALTQRELRKFGIQDRSNGVFRRALHRFIGRASIPIVSEAFYEFDPAILNLRAPCYLKGYWQSPKYFAEIDSLIRDELQVREPLDGENKAMAARIRDSLAVAVHVRCGDYLSNAHTNRYHGTCGPEYYRAAERLLCDRLGTVQLFVFSDDPDWVEANLRFSSPAIVLRHNGPERDYEDLRLMTYCQYHIIANSTFSWWGAWLCQHPDKIVIAPKNWFREAQHRTDDLIPTDWIRL
jgi:hypothetical protein